MLIDSRLLILSYRLELIEKNISTLYSISFALE